MDFLAEAMAIKDEAIILRRDFHHFPEPSKGEVRTNRRIREVLDAASIQHMDPKENITIAVIHCELPGITVGFRCDTDALQLCEDTGLAFRSQVNGMMHACGHDAHIAMGLCTAKILDRYKAELSGTYKVIFQPAEEGERGADDVIATGLVNDVAAFFAIHVWSFYKSGTLHVSPGSICASADMFTVRIHGKGGHGAYPELCIDTVTAGAAIISSLQQIASRLISPLNPVVVTVGSFHAGTRCNIIAQDAVLEGTLRTFDENTRRQVIAHFNRIIEKTSDAFNCGVEIEIRPACDAVVNDERLAAMARYCALQLIPAECVELEEPSMLGDDFAAYATIAPCCYLQVGIGNEAKGTTYAHHHARFDIDEDMLPLGIAWACGFVSMAAAGGQQ
jgi:amidohydrolase